MPAFANDGNVCYYLNMPRNQIRAFSPFEAAMTQLSQRLPAGSALEGAILARLFAHVAVLLGEYFDAPLRAEGLNSTLWTALVVIYSSPEGALKPSDLSVFMISSRTNSTRIADALVSKSFVTREPSALDRRQYFLQLTPKGKRFVERYLSVRRKRTTDLWSQFSAQELKTLDTLLRKLLTRVGH